MSTFHTDLIATNPAYEQLRTQPVTALVDTGAELSWIPAAALEAIQIKRRRTRLFRSADGRQIERDVGYCIIEAQGFTTIDEVVFALPGDLTLLGVRTLEGFGVAVDPVNHRLTQTVTLAAAA